MTLVGKDTAKLYQYAYVEVIPLLTLARDTLFGITGLIEDNLLLPPLRSLFLSNGLGLVPKITRKTITFLGGLMLNIPINSYGQVWTVSSPVTILFPAQA